MAITFSRFSHVLNFVKQVRAVIVENTFLSVSHMVDKLLPMLTSIKWLVLRLNWNNEEKARRLTRPVLYISGETKTGMRRDRHPRTTMCENQSL